MKTQLNKQNRGFTIIEVMIVLGIAGLILAIVLLAVPALQRSQRNNARRSDATHYAGIASDYLSNHGGQVPPNTAALSVAGENFSQLTNMIVVSGVSNAVAGGGPNLNTAAVNTGATCNPSTNAETAQTGAIAISFGIEAPGAPANGNFICIPG